MEKNKRTRILLQFKIMNTLSSLDMHTNRINNINKINDSNNSNDRNDRNDILYTENIK